MEDKFDNGGKVPKPGEIFSNEKGQKYQIITVAKHAVTKEKLVIYQALYGEYDVRALPIERFYTKKKSLADGEIKSAANTEKNKVAAAETKVSENRADSGLMADKKPDLKIKNEDISLKKDECPEGMNLLLYAFLEADTVHDRLKLVKDMDNRKYIDDKCIDDMAASIDVTIDEGDIDERIRQLITCLDTMKRFEIIR